MQTTCGTSHSKILSLGGARGGGDKPFGVEMILFSRKVYISQTLYFTLIITRFGMNCLLGEIHEI